MDSTDSVELVPSLFDGELGPYTEYTSQKRLTNRRRTHDDLRHKHFPVHVRATQVLIAVMKLLRSVMIPAPESRESSPMVGSYHSRNTGSKTNESSASSGRKHRILSPGSLLRRRGSGIARTLALNQLGLASL